MSVYVRNLSFDNNDDFSEVFELEQTGGSPINLTGFSASSYMRKSPESSSYTAFAVGITSAADGTVTLSMGSSITSTLKPGRYVYDLMLERPNGSKTIAVEGNVLVRAGVSTGCF
jgi:hypothetical protein